MCLRWLQLLIKPHPCALSHSGERCLLTLCPCSCFHVYGHRWFAEGSTPRHSHPVRSAGKTAAASLLPLVLGAAGSGPHQPWAHPPSCLHLPPALLSCPGSSLTPAQTIVYQHRPEHSAARRNTHGDGTAVPRPAVHTLPRTACHCQSRAHTCILTPSCQHSCSLLLGSGLSVSHDARVLCGVFSCRLTVEAHTRARGLHTLCALTWAFGLFTCYRVTLAIDLASLGVRRCICTTGIITAWGSSHRLGVRRGSQRPASAPSVGALAVVMTSVASFLEPGHWFSFPTLGCRLHLMFTPSWL